MGAATQDYIRNIRSVPWSGRHAVFLFIASWVLLPVAAYLAIGYAAQYSVALANFESRLIEGDPMASFAIVVLDAIGSFLIIAYFLRKYQVSWRTLGISRFPVWRSLFSIALIFIGFAILISAVFFLIEALMPNFNVDEPQVNEFTANRSAISLWALVLIPPILEETVFRGFTFPAFSRKRGVVFGAVVSSALFGFAHFQANIIVYTFILGLLLCWLYTRTGSIVPGMGLHMLNNYVAYTAINNP